VTFQREVDISRQFITAYYQNFDNNRQAIVQFFRDSSTISFEGATFQGGANYLAKVKCAAAARA